MVETTDSSIFAVLRLEVATCALHVGTKSFNACCPPDSAADLGLLQTGIRMDNRGSLSLMANESGPEKKFLVCNCLDDLERDYGLPAKFATRKRMPARSADQNEWAKKYYRDQRAKGHSKHQALRTLGAKWLKIIFVMWRDHKPYDENYHLANIARHAMRQAA